MSAETGTSSARWVVQLVVLWGIQLVDVLVVTSVIPAIPTMLAATGAPPGAATLLAAATAMAFAGLLMLSSRLGDRFGHRRMLVAGLAVFGLAAVTGGTAHSVGQLVAARVGQGAAAALCVPAAMWALLRLSPEPGRRRTALAGWSAAGAAAGVLGYVVGGGLTEALSWQWVFWVNVPIAVVLMAGALLLVPADSPDARVHLDVWGALLLTAAVMAPVGSSALLQDGLVAWGVAGLAAGAALGVLFAVRQRRAAEPLVDRATQDDPHVRTGVGASFVNTATTSGIAIVVVLILQDDLRLSPATAAVLMMPFSAAVIAGSLASRLPPLATGSIRPTVLGLLAIAAGGLLLAIRHHQVPAIVAAISIAGLGLGLASVGATALGTTATATATAPAAEPPESGSAAVGLLNTAAQLGNALGVAALLALTALPEGGTTAAFLLATTAAAATAIGVGRSSKRIPHVPVDSSVGG